MRFMLVGAAPKALNEETSIGETGTRILKPARSLRRVNRFSARGDLAEAVVPHLGLYNQVDLVESRSDVRARAAGRGGVTAVAQTSTQPASTKNRLRLQQFPHSHTGL